MRKLLHAAISALLIVSACTAPYDDSSIKQDISDLRKRMDDIEYKVSTINSDISRLQDLVQALQNGKRLLVVNEVTKDGESYWELVFSDKTVVTLRNGKDGKDGKDGEDGKDGKDGTNGQDGHSPVIGVRQFTDGLWYWTLDGEWLLDASGNKVRANAIDGKDGKDGSDGENGTDGKDGTNGNTPQLKIEDGFWWVSYTNGSTWIKLYPYAEATQPEDNSPVSDIDTTSSSEYVILTLTNGETIQIPRFIALKIEISSDDISAIDPGSTTDVPYTLTGGTESNVVKAFGQGGWIASVTPTDSHSGIISITAPSPISNAEVIVLANDGAGYTTLASINCVKGEIRFSSLKIDAPSGGGSIEIPLQTNVESYTVETDASWIVYAETRAFRSETVLLDVKPNTGEERYASVLFKNGTTTIATVVVCQGESLPSAFGVWASDGSAVYAYNPSVAQMSLYEAAGEKWFRFVEPCTITIRELGPIPSELSLKQNFHATFSKKTAGETLSSEDVSLTVRSLEDEKLILSTGENTYYVIRF